MDMILLLKIFTGFVIGTILVGSLPWPFGWVMKIRIAFVFALGFFVLGVLSWPFVEPGDCRAAVTLFYGGVSFGDSLILAGIAFICGLAGYFLAWPHGRMVGPVCVPAGMAVWSVRSGNMSLLTRMNPGFEQRMALINSMKWEPFFWFFIVMAGFAGVWTACILCGGGDGKTESLKKNLNRRYILNVIIAVAFATAAAKLLVSVLVTDVRVFLYKSPDVISQPEIGQIVFGVVVTFGLVSYGVKRFLGMGWFWTALCSSLLIAYAAVFSLSPDQYHLFSLKAPAGTYMDSVFSVLPVQMVSFGTLGALGGYWLAGRQRDSLMNR